MTDLAFVGNWLVAQASYVLTHIASLPSSCLWFSAAVLGWPIFHRLSVLFKRIVGNL